jgi:hypothetical protein
MCKFDCRTSNLEGGLHDSKPIDQIFYSIALQYLYVRSKAHMDTSKFDFVGRHCGERQVSPPLPTLSEGLQYGDVVSEFRWSRTTCPHLLDRPINHGQIVARPIVSSYSLQRRPIEWNAEHGGYLPRVLLLSQDPRVAIDREVD